MAGNVRRRGAWIVSSALAAAALLLVYFVDPAGASGHASSPWQVLFPSCLLRRTTGLLCPGCGSTRMLHELLHGHVREAFWLNPLLFVLLPVLLWFLLEAGHYLVTGRRVTNYVPSRRAAAVLLVVALVFAVARNFWPLTTA